MGDEPFISPEPAIKIAEAKTPKMGYDVTEIYPLADEDNKKMERVGEGLLTSDLHLTVSEPLRRRKEGEGRFEVFTAPLIRWVLEAAWRATRCRNPQRLALHFHRHS